MDTPEDQLPLDKVEVGIFRARVAKFTYLTRKSGCQWKHLIIFFSELVCQTSIG